MKTPQLAYADSSTAREIEIPPFPASQDLPPPAAKLQLAELSSARFLAHLAVQWRKLPIDPSGQRKVMIIPGFYGGELSINPIKYFLRRQGHFTHSWGLGLNKGEIETLQEPLLKRLDALHRKHEEPIDLVGWSLGGIFARELARMYPEAVRQVITLGSPVIGGPRVTALHPLSSLFNWDLEQIEQDMLNSYATPIPQQVHAIYSRNDGIVNWQACIDHWSPNVKHHEVATTHTGMGFCTEVLQLVDRLLKQ
ncbi:MAG: alpha/beta fold hydrolase [Oleiphilaceae bacterium]|nr:alpha/beta fold hydrolase [Oleiphilaceae bacterium]